LLQADYLRELTQDCSEEYAHNKRENINQALEISLAQAANEDLRWKAYNGQLPD